MKLAHTIDLGPLPAATGRRFFALGVVVVTMAFAYEFPIPQHSLMAIACGVVVVGAALYRPRSLRFPVGTSFRGRIESKLGPYVLAVVDDELRACPFIVRLDDGRAALVGDSGLLLEAPEPTVGVGARVELIGNPHLSHYAPEGYRGGSVLWFQGDIVSPVGVRAL